MNYTDEFFSHIGEKTPIIAESKIKVYDLPSYEYEWGNNKISVNNPITSHQQYYKEQINDCYETIRQIKDGYDNYNEWEKHKADLDIIKYEKYIQSLEISAVKEKTSYLLYDTNKDNFDKIQQLFNILCGYNDIIYSSAPVIHYNKEHDTYYICCDGEIVVPFEWINEKQCAEYTFDNIHLVDSLRKAHDFNIVFDRTPIDIINRNFIYYARCKNIVVFVKNADYIDRMKTIDDLKRNGLQ